MRGEFDGAGGELLLLEALLLGFLGTLVGGELVLDDGIGLRAVDAAGGDEQLRDARCLPNSSTPPVRGTGRLPNSSTSDVTTDR
nr:hypothetical protein StreXyl84_00040 [Streptomyces sp. Xyl84]BFD86999.1 hypothetical protein StreXyl84_64000 [Streptomyces sp. Xyl84]